MGVGAWAVALTVLATGRQGRRSALLAASGGLLFGAALLLTYGAVLLALVPAAVATARRRIAPLLWAGAGAAAVGTGFLAAGFAWWEGLAETRRTYLAGAGGKRPGGYFLLANPAALGLAVGPAAAVGLARLRDGRVWLLAGGALAAVALADISGMSRGEVERIWLPFVPWLLTACAALGRRAASRLWLALHLASGLGLQLLVRAPW